MKALLISLTLIILVGCGGNDSDSRARDKVLKDLERGQEKSITGAPMTDSEKRTLDSFNNWQKEQKAQEYNKKTIKIFY